MYATCGSVKQFYEIINPFRNFKECALCKCVTVDASQKSPYNTYDCQKIRAADDHGSRKAIRSQKWRRRI